MGMRNGFILAFIAVLVFSSATVSAQVTVSPTPTFVPAPTVSSSPTISSPTPSPNPLPPTPTIVYPKPSVPEFNLSYSSINGIILLTIINQAFSPYTDANGVPIYMVYNIRASTNNGYWTELYNAEDGYPQPSNSDFTAFSFAVGNSTYNPGSITLNNRLIGVFPVNGQIDFQVDAKIGYRTRGQFSEGMMPYIFKGETSGWSNTKTVNVIKSDTLTTATPYYPPRNPPHLEPNDYLLPIGVIAIVTILSALLYYWKHRISTVPYGTKKY